MQTSLSWILASLSVALFAGAAVLWFLQGRKPRVKPLPSEWALTSRPIFSSDERRVYRQLREALPHHIVLSKLPLVRFCQPIDPQRVRYWYELLGSTHVAFAVCSANGRVLAAIDLETDHNRSRRSLQIKQSVLAACRVRYLRCPPDMLPSIPELQLLVPHSGATARGPQPAPTATAARDTRSSPSRRRERTTLWQDSSSLQDSFFGVDGLGETLNPNSSFGASRSGAPLRDYPPVPDDVGGVVIDAPVAPLRH
jgi:hypothetical protein